LDELDELVATAFPFFTVQFSGAPSFWHAFGFFAVASRMFRPWSMGRVIAVGELVEPDAGVARDLAVLDQPARDQVARQRGIAELVEMRLTGAKDEVDPFTGR
jgi:hypothetical protein